MKLVVDNEPPVDPARLSEQRVQNIQDWFAMYRSLVAGGATRDQAAEMMIPALKALLPMPPGKRTTPWRYYCETCGDTGQRWSSEEDVNRGERQIKVPCFCAKGTRIQAAREEAAHNREAKQPKRGWSHVGTE